MIPEGIRDQFELYRKWFKTLLIKDFLNLPTKYQERFLIIAQSFLNDCKRVFEEGKGIKEKEIVIEISRIEEPYMFGTCSECEEEIKISIPKNRSKTKIGSKFHYTVFSLDEIVWYSSKRELLKKQRS